jgi:hypothetical protein
MGRLKEELARTDREMEQVLARRDHILGLMAALEADGCR